MFLITSTVPLTVVGPVGVMPGISIAPAEPTNAKDIAAIPKIPKNFFIFINKYRYEYTNLRIIRIQNSFVSLV